MSPLVGERALYQGIMLTKSGKQCDVIGGAGDVVSVRFDDGLAVLATAASLTPVPRRPRPDF